MAGLIHTSVVPCGSLGFSPVAGTACDTELPGNNRQYDHKPRSLQVSGAFRRRRTKHAFRIRDSDVLAGC